MKIRFSELFSLFIAVGSPVVLKAQLQTAKIFTSGMVLQRERDIPVWGTAGADDTIVMSLNGLADSAFADEAGNGIKII